MTGFSEFLNFSAHELAASESFQAYILKENEADTLFWEEFINLYPEKHADVQTAREILLVLNFRKAVTSAQTKQSALDRLFSALPVTGQDKEEALQVEQSTPASPRSVFRQLFPESSWLMAACVAALAFALCLGAFFREVIFPDPSITYKTAYGENTTLILPDSSIAILNGNTTLRYEKNWEHQGIREVWLDGEAFFDVRHKAESDNARFIVHSPGMDVEVLGTQFNVFNRKDKANVVLNSGKVKVKIVALDDTTSLFMVPDEAIEFSRKDQTIIRKHVKAEILTSWRNKVLVFENTPLYKIGEMIENTYGVRVIFKPEVDQTEELAGTIPSENLEMLLTVLAKSSNLDITRDNDQIIIAKKKQADSQN